MLSGIYRNPTEIIFGKNSLTALGSCIRRFSRAEATKVLVVHGSNVYERYGIGARVRAELDRAGILYVELGGVRPSPNADIVYRGIELCRQTGVHAIIAVGGGSVIDTAKAIGVGVEDDGDFFDFFEGKRPPKRMIPVVTVLTIFGAGSESSDGAVISKNGKKRSAGGPMMYPAVSILDPTLTETVPPSLLASGIFDSMSHVFERYFSPTAHVETTTELCFGLLRVLSQLGPRLVADPNDEDVRANVMWASKLAHDNTVGFGRKHDWGTHTIAHEVGERTNRPHGAVLAVLFPAWMRYMRPFHGELFAELGRKVFAIGGESSDEIGIKTIDEVQAVARRLGLPLTLTELGMNGHDAFEEIADSCASTTVSGTIGNLRRLTRSEIVQVLRIATGVQTC